MKSAEVLGLESPALGSGGVGGAGKGGSGPRRPEVALH